MEAASKLGIKDRGDACVPTVLLITGVDHCRTLDSPTVGPWEGVVSYERGTPVIKKERSGVSTRFLGQ